MLALAQAFLIVAAVDAGAPHDGPPRAAPNALSEEDRRAADHYVKEGKDWTNELTALGEKLGNMLADVLDGKTTGKAMRAEIKRVTALIDDRIAYFTARPSPGFPEMVAYRTLFNEYVAWERRTFVRMIGETVQIVEDKKRSRDEKASVLMKSVRAYDAEEQVWKAKFVPARAAVYAAINRK